MTSLAESGINASCDEKQLSKEEKRKIKDKRRYEAIMADEERRLQYRRTARSGHLQRTYGITLDEYEKALAEQNNCCAICEVHESDAPRQRLAVDHCHDTGKIRGFLCDRCNLALGMLGDGAKQVEKALNYLIKADVKNDNTKQQ